MEQPTTSHRFTPDEEKALIERQSYIDNLLKDATATDQPPVLSFFGTHRFLSNFWEGQSELVVNGMIAPTAEHIYQASKTKDGHLREEILAAPTPGKAKRAGAALNTAQIRPGWDAIKLGVMADILDAKFQHQDLSDLMLATGDAMLIEGNDWCDVFWGCCNCELHQGAGLNHLGVLLMVERSKIMRELVWQ